MEVSRLCVQEGEHTEYLVTRTEAVVFIDFITIPVIFILGQSKLHFHSFECWHDHVTFSVPDNVSRCLQGSVHKILFLPYSTLHVKDSIRLDSE